jgi:hypothetical protein
MAGTKQNVKLQHQLIHDEGTEEGRQNKNEKIIKELRGKSKS